MTNYQLLNLNKYIQSLISGIYTMAGKNYFRDKIGFCPLGVGIDLIGQNIWDKAETINGTISLVPPSVIQTFYEFYGLSKDDWDYIQYEITNKNIKTNKDKILEITALYLQGKTNDAVRQNEPAYLS